MPFLLLMPSYNQERYVGEAVDSILAQDDPDWQLWIVDNSSDSTPEILARYRDPRIRFHHFPERMSPGHCLNWMLARAEGRDFSYVHTDNRLLPDYVRAMRAALSHDACSLAYCDLYLIDAGGRRKALPRRGRFGLPRLLGLSPLGVPFSATTELARRLGGFSEDDVADDVLFCTRAYGRSQWHYLPAALMEYRHHGGSRTELHGGYAEVQRALMATASKVLPELVGRGLDPLGEMRRALREICDDLRWAAEDQVLRTRARGARWWSGDDFLEGLWAAGLVRIPGRILPNRSLSLGLLRTARASLLNPMRVGARAPGIRKAMNRALEPRAADFEHVLLSLVQLECGSGPFMVYRAARDLMSCWAAALIASRLGWRIVDATPRPGAQDFLWLDLSGQAERAPRAAPALVL